MRLKQHRHLAAFLCLMAMTLLFPQAARAEQKQQLGPFEAHYVVVNTTFFKEEVAARYGVVRGRDRALVNVSFLDESGTPVPVELSGTVKNLLSQVESLQFREVREGPAIYYLAEIRHTDRETLRFRIQVVTPDGVARELAFQQQMFWDGR
jgi:hypothetical protein